MKNIIINVSSQAALFRQQGEDETAKEDISHE
jgi:hypothetical protein